MIHIPRRVLLSVLFVLVQLFSLYPVTAEDITVEDPAVLNQTGFEELAGSRTHTLVSDLVSLLSLFGVDISYGEEGETIFSMIETSLAQIIEDLSSGNPEGMRNNTLIRETLDYLGTNPDSVILDPREVSGGLAVSGKFDEGYKQGNESGIRYPGLG